MKQTKTGRGFSLIEFEDRSDTPCTLQESSLATQAAIWFGVDKAEPLIMASEIIDGGTGWAKYPLPDNVHINTRMHLTQEQVRNLLPVLVKFVETGEI